MVFSDTQYHAPSTRRLPLAFVRMESPDKIPVMPRVSLEEVRVYIQRDVDATVTYVLSCGFWPTTGATSEWRQRRLLKSHSSRCYPSLIDHPIGLYPITFRQRLALDLSLTRMLA